MNSSDIAIGTGFDENGERCVSIISVVKGNAMIIRLNPKTAKVYADALHNCAEMIDWFNEQAKK